MNCKWDLICEAGLQFFGKMSASISHEIKNTLAIINEDAGLLEDFTLMADKGIPLEPDRLKALAGKIKKQIRRTDGIVKNMNRFAHSVDESGRNIDVGELLEFVAALAGRFAFMRGVTLKTEPPAGRVTISKNPFFLENLVWLCLDFAMDAAGGGKNIDLITEEKENSVLIRLTRLEGLAEAQTNTFPAEQEKALLGVLKAELVANVEAGELVISPSRDMGR